MFEQSPSNSVEALIHNLKKLSPEEFKSKVGQRQITLFPEIIAALPDHLYQALQEIEAFRIYQHREGCGCLNCRKDNTPDGNWQTAGQNLAPLRQRRRLR